MRVRVVAPALAAAGTLLSCAGFSSALSTPSPFRTHAPQEVLGLSSVVATRRLRGGSSQQVETAATPASQDSGAGEGDNDNLRAIMSRILTETLSGTTVALASIPSSIAFATIAGVDPLVGIWSSVIHGAVSSLVGMRKGVITGAAGVVAVPLGGLVATAGVKYMGPTILMASLIEFIFGLLKGGKLINFVRYVWDYCTYCILACSVSVRGHACTTCSGGMCESYSFRL
jgi:hypothetical protein